LRVQIAALMAPGPLLLAVSLVLAGGTSQGRSQAAAAVTVTTVEFVTMHEPVVLRVSIANVEDTPLVAQFGWNRVGGFSFELTGPDGSRSTRTPTVQEGIAKSETVVVQPRGAFSYPIILDEWFPMSQVGDYSLSVTFAGSVTRQGDDVSVGPLQRLRFRILDRDPGRLKARCAELQRRALDRHGSDFLDASAELSYVRDPIAVPYLLALITARESVRAAVQGLGRIDGPEATKALEDLSTHTDPEVATLAIRALQSRAGR
jgi:hypothetical protein